MKVPNPHENSSRWAGLILLIDGEVDSAKRSRDEHNQTGILTSNCDPHSRLPGYWPVAFGEFVIRYSGATVPDSHGVP
jgi:hypothetical protein